MNRKRRRLQRPSKQINKNVHPNDLETRAGGDSFCPPAEACIRTQCNLRNRPTDVSSELGSLGPGEGAVQAKKSRQRKVSTNSTGNAEHAQGLLLDDFLATTELMRRDFQLPVPQFGLKEMEQHPRVREALEVLIQSTIDRHGTQIYARHHPLLSRISMDVYLEEFVSKVYSCSRISPN